MKARLQARSQLPAPVVAEMHDLLARHFSGVTDEQFLADLEAKNWVILMRDAHDQLVGFTTLHFEATSFGDEPESVLYSGDTIMDPEAWNSSILARSFLEAALFLGAEFGRGSLWWLLITSGFRTYRFLPTFMREFYPRCDTPTPPDVRERLHRLASQRFGPRYDRSSGIVRFDQPQRLREHLQGIPEHRLRNRHVAFFNELNPGHLHGDELVSISRLEPDNLTAAGRRMLASIRSEPVLTGGMS